MELKPCPFCGATEPTVHILDAPESLVVCDYRKGGCGASVRPFNTDKQAIEAWSDRPERTCHDVLGEVEPFECSECHRRTNDTKYPNYCWYCGAKVVEE